MGTLTVPCSNHKDIVVHTLAVRCHSLPTKNQNEDWLPSVTTEWQQAKLSLTVSSSGVWQHHHMAWSAHREELCKAGCMGDLGQL